MQLIIITQDSTSKNETAIVNQLFRDGMQILHLRKPRFNTGDHRSYIKNIEPQYHSRIVINKCFGLYDEFKLGGIHLNSFLRTDPSIWAEIKTIPLSNISTSFHSWLEIENDEFEYGYVFISPVFDSISKSGYKAGIDLNGASVLRQKLAKQNKYCPSIIGLGGVGEPEINILHQYGFDGAAVLGAIWTASDPIEKFREILLAAKSL